MDLNAYDAPLCLSVHTPNAAITTYSDTLLASRNDGYHFLRLVVFWRRGRRTWALLPIRFGETAQTDSAKSRGRLSKRTTRLSDYSDTLL